MITENLLSQINKGREGRNWGLPMGLPKLEQYIDGVSQGTYTLLFSGSGVGKSSFALYSYVYRPIMDRSGGRLFRRTIHLLRKIVNPLRTSTFQDFNVRCLLGLYMWNTTKRGIAYGK